MCSDEFIIFRSGSFVLYMCNIFYHVWISAFYARYFTILKSGDDNL